MERLTRAQMTLIRSLATAKGRRETGLFVAEGPKLIQELCDGGLECVLKAVSGANISPADFGRISQLKSPQGVIAAFRIPHHDMESIDMQHLVMALDGVQDPGNMGTILRLADWFGVEDVVCSAECASAFQPKVVQACMGALARVRVHRTSNLAEWIAGCPKDVPVYGTFLDGEPLCSASFGQRGVVVMGNEGQGITHDVAQYVTHRILIPNYPQGRRCVESLNVATAAAIVLSHIRNTR